MWKRRLKFNTFPRWDIFPIHALHIRSSQHIKTASNNHIYRSSKLQFLEDTESQNHKPETQRGRAATKDKTFAPRRHGDTEKKKMGSLRTAVPCRFHRGRNIDSSNLYLHQKEEGTEKQSKPICAGSAERKTIKPLQNATKFDISTAEEAEGGKILNLKFKI
jgi:hypothetical protein